MVRRRRHQKGYLYKTGKRRQVWRARWVEPVMFADGTIGSVLRNEIIAEVRDVPSRRRAQDLLNDKLRSLNQGSHKPQSVATFRDFVEEHWVPKIMPTFKPSTTEIYRVLLRKHILPHFAEMRLCDLRTADVQGFVVEKAGTGLAWNSVRHLRTLVSSILRTAQEWQFVTANAARGVRLPPKQLSRLPKLISPEDVRALLRELPEPKRTMVLVCLLTGVRAGELFALRWRHVDFERGILHVREAVHKNSFGPPKTKSSVRDLPLGTIGLSALVEQRKRAIGSKPDDLIFPSRKGTALRRNNLLRRVLYPACDKIGIQRIGWHGLRHLHSTLQSEAGVPMKVIQAQMGHADLETTLTTYTHVVPGSQRRAVGKVEELIFPNFPKFTSVEPERDSVIQ